MESLTGRGVGVAILDTGIYPHMDFDNRILAFADFVNGRERPYDDNSHGSHVAGIIGGSGRASGGRYRGVAPGCRLVSLKVLDKKGNGKVENVLQGLAWIIQNHQKYNIRIVNISFGAHSEEESTKNVLVQAVEKVWDAGVVVVTAAGNEGPQRGSITVPGVSKKVITVGAFDDKEYIDDEGKIHRNYSGRGPTCECVVKPEILAVGSKIVSCGNNRGGYMVKSGTSMAAPIVTGSIALLLEKYPGMSPREVKLRLLDRAVPIGLQKSHQGWGILDLNRFLE